jgi:hypothetical protein
MVAGIGRNGGSRFARPPGVTYWRKVGESADGRLIWSPTTRPLAAIARHEILDDDIRVLLRQLVLEARTRGIDIDAALAPPAPGDVIQQMIDLGGGFHQFLNQ